MRRYYANTQYLVGVAHRLAENARDAKEQLVWFNVKYIIIWHANIGTFVLLEYQRPISTA